ncbi:MAG: hypothetical protein GX306_08395 [Clostridiales bacterium]|jgi:hypothetical protein|nr:hypothetical protein [Clostridiales bacterium]NLL87283.1 hypothetical protein [Syntrophomonadaceae bacterium]
MITNELQREFEEYLAEALIDIDSLYDTRAARDLLDVLVTCKNAKEFFQILSVLSIASDALQFQTVNIAFRAVGLTELAWILDDPQKMQDYCRAIVSKKKW